MEYFVLLRGVTPTGKNRIPKMSILRSIIEDAGFKNVTTYIQSGNVIFDSDLLKTEVAKKVHMQILENIGADLKVIVKSRKELAVAVNGNPFDDTHDYSRVHLAFFNELLSKLNLDLLKNISFWGEKLSFGSECLYMYLPRDTAKKRLNTNFLERKLQTDVTTRKINVITKLMNLERN
ncbi:DUF1697 domain-containing protein [Liquorilactobacillus uvarum]|uniref:DUF1697 domain-containing protein n=1 Tax=Liquorilactobacillus uvarum DSM 19971 TaxID=1423812 RepID=A0A0R1Q7D7_9LACO|nr:DUF1697 domain-containing protein [Liquorilactobacillus uvarum]KRL37163.1 hypothetical protein FD20_GL000633 [Liquorilactobacillus uvarum DSM 19971]